MLCIMITPCMIASGLFAQEDLGEELANLCNQEYVVERFHPPSGWLPVPASGSVTEPFIIPSELDMDCTGQFEFCARYADVQNPAQAWVHINGDNWYHHPPQTGSGEKYECVSDSNEGVFYHGDNTFLFRSAYSRMALNEKADGWFVKEITLRVPYYEPPGYSAAANAEASSMGSNSLKGSGMCNQLVLMFIPAGAVVLLRLVRRRRKAK